MGEWHIWAKSSRDSRVLSGCSELVSLLLAPVVGICTLPLTTCSWEFSYLNYTTRSMENLSRLPAMVWANYTEHFLYEPCH